MKKRVLFMLLTGLSAMFLFTNCSKDDQVVAADASTVELTKSANIVAFDLAMETELSEDGLDDLMLCAYNCLNSLPNETLSPEEVQALTFVREEELLAHDVYQAMYALYPVPVFNFISNSESLHSYAMKVLLDKYSLPDPAADHQPGVFTNPAIQQLYTDLVAFGSQSIENALTVGATIEDYDIADIIQHTGSNVDNQDLIYAFGQLHKGSRNHMRAFNAHLVFRNITYTPQYITQEMFDAIVGSGWEVGQGFCICQCTASNSAAASITE